jgi:hypothetical protein
MLLIKQLPRELILMVLLFRIGAKHIPQVELDQKLIDAGFAALKEKEIAFFYGSK